MEDEFQAILEKMKFLFKQKDQTIQELQNRLETAEREISRLISEKIEDKQVK